MDFLRKRLPAQVGRYLEGVEFPARKEELLGRLERNGVPGPSSASCARGSPKGSIVARRTFCRPCDGAVSRLEPPTYELLRNAVNAKFAKRPLPEVR